MKPLLTAAQMKLWDQFTIERDSLSGLGLMERAATRCFHTLIPMLQQENKILNQQPFIVCCGQGNNGGDGLVIARLLKENGFSVQVYILHLKEKGTEEFEINLLRCQAVGIEAIHINSEENFPLIPTHAILIDALFGSGLNKPLEGLAKALVQYLNKSRAKIVSIDIPSGIFADAETAIEQSSDAIIQAYLTLCFELPKSSFLFTETGKYAGKIEVVSIDLNENYLASLDSNYIWVDTLENLPDAASHLKQKWQKGHLLFVGGSYGKTGAALLSSKAALRAGCGLVTAHIPASAYGIFQSSVPEIMVHTDAHTNEVATFPEVDTFTALAVGPGLGWHPDTIHAFGAWLNTLKKPLVLDADALNICAVLMKDSPAFTFPEGCIITPHFREFDRMFGVQKNSYTRMLKAIDIAAQYRIIVVLKDVYSKIVLPSGQVFFNSTGHPLLATAGSGDVLTGIIGSLLAQGNSPETAAINGVFLHGKLAQYLAKNAYVNCIAGDLVEALKFNTI